MSRYYTQLECGCLVSCDGGGGLIPHCEDGNPKCKVTEYFSEHEMLYAVCKKCQPDEYKKVLQNLRNECLSCFTNDLLNYYTKPDGNIIKEYWRCNNCLEIIELTVSFDGEVIRYRTFEIYENIS
jgi:hypothetical protein